MSCSKAIVRNPGQNHRWLVNRATYLVSIQVYPLEHAAAMLSDVEQPCLSENILDPLPPGAQSAPSQLIHFALSPFFAMRFGLNTLTKFLNQFGSRKLIFSPRSTYLPNIFARRDPRTVARSGGTNSRHCYAPSKTSCFPEPAREDAPCQTPQAVQHHHHLTASHVLYPHPPGAYILEPSFVVPSFPDVDHCHIPPLVAQKPFRGALWAPGAAQGCRGAGRTGRGG